jgi:AhpD family alkylhydroperoxidase
MPDKSTQPRLDITKVSPGLYKAMAGLQNYVDASGLERKLLDLIKVRASQINGCAYCIVMHTNDARKRGENDEWMHLLNAWREAPIYSARERAALAWTEAVTKISDHHVPDCSSRNCEADPTIAPRLVVKKHQFLNQSSNPRSAT